MMSKSMESIPRPYLLTGPRPMTSGNESMAGRWRRFR